MHRKGTLLVFESVVQPAKLDEAVKKGIRRIENVAAGRMAGLTEKQYRTAVRRRSRADGGSEKGSAPEFCNPIRPKLKITDFRA